METVRPKQELIYKRVALALSLTYSLLLAFQLIDEGKHPATLLIALAAGPALYLSLIVAGKHLLLPLWTVLAGLARLLWTSISAGRARARRPALARADEQAARRLDNDYAWAMKPLMQSERLDTCIWRLRIRMIILLAVILGAGGVIVSLGAAFRTGCSGSNATAGLLSFALIVVFSGFWSESNEKPGVLLNQLLDRVTELSAQVDSRSGEGKLILPGQTTCQTSCPSLYQWGLHVELPHLPLSIKAVDSNNLSEEKGDVDLGLKPWDAATIVHAPDDAMAYEWLPADLRDLLLPLLLRGVSLRDGVLSARLDLSDSSTRQSITWVLALIDAAGKRVAALNQLGRHSRRVEALEADDDQDARLALLKVFEEPSGSPNQQKLLLHWAQHGNGASRLYAVRRLGKPSLARSMTLDASESVEDRAGAMEQWHMMAPDELMNHLSTSDDPERMVAVHAMVSVLRGRSARRADSAELRTFLTWYDDEVADLPGRLMLLDESEETGALSVATQNFNGAVSVEPT